MNDSERDFTPFPVPVHHMDTPLVQWAGEAYKCTGCGGVVPSGAWLHETIKDGMVTGLLARNGADGEILHRCGEQVDD